MLEILRNLRVPYIFLYIYCIDSSHYYSLIVVDLPQQPG